VCGFEIVSRIATPDMDGYDGLIDWINAQNYAMKKRHRG